MTIQAGQRLGNVFPYIPSHCIATLLFRPRACRRMSASRHGAECASGDLSEIAMGLQQSNIESLPFVTAELNYLAPIAGKPRTYAFDPPPGEPKTTVLPEPRRVPIFDARPIAGGISLDREGFALVRHPTVVRNFYDDK